MGNLNITKQFEKAYNDLSDDIFRHCYFRLSDRERAKEIAQDVFLKTWDYLYEENVVNNMRAFIYKVANNLIINEYERKKKSVSLDAMNEDSGFEPGDDADHSVVIQSKIDGELIMGKLHKLDLGYRDIVFMRYVDGFSIKEISEMINETENNVSVRLHRGLSKLKEIYENNKIQ